MADGIQAQSSAADVYESIFSNIDAFVYRCAFDDDHTMESMFGSVQRLTGHDARDLIGNSTASYASLIHPEDAQSVRAVVEKAIATGSSWNCAYRLKHRSGDYVHVRERGAGVHLDGQIAYLEGQVANAEAELELRAALQRKVDETAENNKEILEIAKNIITSVEALSLLSVNASIEAARSGQAGLGFSVVANEIKVLADGNAKWAAEIARKISNDGARRR